MIDSMVATSEKMLWPRDYVKSFTIILNIQCMSDIMRYVIERIIVMFVNSYVIFKTYCRNLCKQCFLLVKKNKI